MALRDGFICFSYGLISVANNVSNKILVSQYALPPFFVLLIQELLILSVFLIRSKNFSYKIFRQTLLLSALSMGNLGFGLLGMKYVNLPMYLCIRKLTTLLIFTKNQYDGQKSRFLTQFGVCFITLGGFIAGSNDITGDFLGYLIVFLSTIMNALQLIVSNELGSQGLNSDDIFFYSSISVVPAALVLSWQTNEKPFNSIEKLLGAKKDFTYVIIGCCSSALASYMTVFCSTKVSPMAASVTGNMKDLGSMIIGLLLFPNPNTQTAFLLGLGFSTLGAFSYAYSKITQKNLKSN